MNPRTLSSKYDDDTLKKYAELIIKIKKFRPVCTGHAIDFAVYLGLIPEDNIPSRPTIDRAIIRFGIGKGEVTRGLSRQHANEFINGTRRRTTAEWTALMWQALDAKPCDTHYIGKDGKIKRTSGRGKFLRLLEKFGLAKKPERSKS